MEIMDMITSMAAVKPSTCGQTVQEPGLIQLNTWRNAGRRRSWVGLKDCMADNLFILVSWFAFFNQFNISFSWILDPISSHFDLGNDNLASSLQKTQERVARVCSKGSLPPWEDSDTGDP